MSASLQGRTLPRFRRPRAPRLLAWAIVLLVLAAGQAHAQELNFKPLERGDYTEEEQRIIMLRGLEASANYAAEFRNDHQATLPTSQRGSRMQQDFRLKLDSIYNQDVRLHLSLDLSTQSFSSADLRAASGQSTGQVTDSLPTVLNVREAYLRFNFNPRSGIVIGKQELSLGDRRGKTFDALVPGITFDCQVGTWCMPFGVAFIGRFHSDAVTHWALQYNAYDTPRGPMKDLLKVEVFRIRYAEGDVPLGTNLGPALYNSSDPTASSSAANSSQLLDTGTGNQPIYYDAHAEDYFGFRVDWKGGPLFANFDAVAFRGTRTYHLYNLQQDLALTKDRRTAVQVRGTALESEAGFRWDQGHVGLRMMSATGDSYQAYSNGQRYDRSLGGYYEITPGSYQGTRLYFNGVNTNVSDGSGLGHSINNTRMVGIYVDWKEPDVRRMGYQGGLYSLSLNNPIPDSEGHLKSNIGVEWDNMLTWYARKSITLQFEANAILAGGAFRVSDYVTPSAGQRNYYQMLARLLYSF